MVNRFTAVRSPAIAAVHIVFALNGFLFATWVSRLPAVRQRLDASEPQLGVALLFIAIGSLLTMPATGWLCDRFGLRRVFGGAVVACVAGWQLAVAAPTIWALAIALGVAGGMFGLWDVIMNASAHAVEQTTGRPLMPAFHGAFSVGGLVGAGLGAMAAGAGLHVSVHMALAGAVALTVGLAARQQLLSPPPSDDALEGPEPSARRRRIPVRLMVIGLIAGCSAMGEGAAADWGAIFLHDERGASEAMAATGYAVFSLAMAVGRFGGTALLRWFTRVRALRLSGVLIAVTLTALVVIDAFPVALLAMIGWGFGVALVFPAVMSAAAEHSTRPAHGIAVVSSVGYGGFLLGPPLIGFLAGNLGLGAALLVVAVLGVGLSVLAPAANAPRSTTATEGDHDADDAHLAGSVSAAKD